MLFKDAHLEEPLCNLNFRWLFFEDYNNKDSLPFDLFHKAPNLECLKVQICLGLKEIFPSQKLQVNKTLLARLKQLVLADLIHLERVGLEHSWVQPYFEKLQVLKLENCTRLQKVVSGMSFIDLKELHVKNCERMEYLFTSAIVKSWMKLEILVLKNCESIKEIVKDEEGCDEMVFERLRSIKLNCLPRLESFYSGTNCHFAMLIFEKRDGS